MKILGIDPGYGITGFGLVAAERNQFRLLRCDHHPAQHGICLAAQRDLQ